MKPTDATTLAAAPAPDWDNRPAIPRIPTQRPASPDSHTGDSDPDMDEALRRIRRAQPCPVTHGELAARAHLDTLGVTL